MGIRKKLIYRIILKIIAVALILYIAPIGFWWATITVGTLFVLLRILSLELIIIGAYLDITLINNNSGFHGLFYSPIFFVIVIMFILVRIYQLKNNERQN